jgi:hypothetical protein
LSRWRWASGGLERAGDDPRDLLTLRARAGVARGALRRVTGWDWFQDRPVLGSWEAHEGAGADADGDPLYTFALDPQALYLVEVCGAGDLKEVAYLRVRGDRPVTVPTREAPAHVWGSGGAGALDEALDGARWTLAWAIACSGGGAQARARVLAALDEALRAQATGPLAGSVTQARQGDRLREAALGLLRAALRAVRGEDASRDPVRFALLTSAYNLRALDRARSLFRVRWAIDHGELGALVWEFADNGRRRSEVERRVAPLDLEDLPEL